MMGVGPGAETLIAARVPPGLPPLPVGVSSAAGTLIAARVPPGLPPLPVGVSSGAETLITERATWLLPESPEPEEAGAPAWTACVDWLHAGAIVAAAGAAASAAVMNVSDAMRRAVAPRQGCARTR